MIWINEFLRLRYKNVILKEAVLTSSCWTSKSYALVKANSVLMLEYLATGEKTSSLSTPCVWKYSCATSLALYQLMLLFASRLTCRTHFDPTMLASLFGGTNSHVSWLINETYSVSKASFHSHEFLPFKASFIDCGSSLSPVNNSETFLWMKSHRCFSLCG